MSIPANIIANADDLGIRPSVNGAILTCYKKGYINSSSLLTNTDYFDETINFIYQNPSICNLGVHVNLAEGKPVSDFKNYKYLNEDGSWKLTVTGKAGNTLSNESARLFKKEIFAQVDKALDASIPITHLDSHYHLHTLPCFYNLFLQAAKHYNLKLRLAQTTKEGNYLKFAYRRFINRKFKNGHVQHSDYFETVNHFLENGTAKKGIIEIMLHPDMDESGELTDHYDNSELKKWIDFLKNKR